MAWRYRSVILCGVALCLSGCLVGLAVGAGCDRNYDQCIQECELDGLGASCEAECDEEFDACEQAADELIEVGVGFWEALFDSESC